MQFEVEKWKIESVEAQSRIIKNLADAESKELGPQLEKYKTDMQGLIAKEKIDVDRKRAVSGVAPSSGDKGSKKDNAGKKG